MNKMQIAHEYAMKHIQEGWDINYDVLVVEAWQYADAMQAEAEEREDKTRPEVLYEVDWSQAPETAIAWKMQSKSNAVWIHNKSLSAFDYSIAPSFNYQSNWQDSLRKRPEVLCEVDWRIAPEWAKYWAVREDSDTALWCINKPTVTDDCFLSHGGCSPAPSFGFTGSHIVERPQ